MIYSIPFSLPFLGTIADYLFKQQLSFPLSEWTVYLPTRRACSVLENVLLEKACKKSLILPRIIPLGEVNPEELSLLSCEGAEKVARLPPVITTSRRRLLLGALIEKFQYADHAIPFDQALRWSANLMDLLDQMRTYDIDLKTLQTNITLTSQAEHWEKIQKFLTLVSDHWDSILEEESCIEAVTWQKKLMEIQGSILEKNKPPSPIMVAGSLGTIPSTLGLMEVISRLPNGIVILPGFQKGLEKEALSPHHPQFFLYRLLSHLGISTEDVKQLEPTPQNPSGLFLEKIFECSLPKNVSNPFLINNIEYVEASNQGEEARLIALAIRQALEEGKKKILCVSADQNLLSRISVELELWDLSVCPQHGSDLSDTDMGSFLHLATLWFSSTFQPTIIAAIFNHPFCKNKKEHWSLFERHILRTWTGVVSISTLDHIVGRSQKNLDSEKFCQLQVFYTSFRGHLSSAEGPHTLGHYLSKIESLISWLLETDKKTEELFLQLSPEYGLMFQNLWADLKKSSTLEVTNPSKLSDIFLTLLKGQQVSINSSSNEKIFLMSPAEARFMESDFRILAGINEGVWPAQVSVDPFFSSSIRRTLNLPSLECRFGQSAHDFLSYLCAPGNLLITRSLQVGGVSSIPSRFLSHLEVAAKLHDLKIPRNLNLKEWVKTFYHETKKVHLPPPIPLPSLTHRPTRFSITDISLLMEDPYSIYAKYILKLRKLEPFESEHKPRLFGVFVHDFLHRWPLKSHTALDGLFQQRAKFLFELYLGSLEKNRFWWEKFLILVEWVKHQKTLDRTLTEVNGEIVFAAGGNLFTLFGKADRIDWDKEGVVIIDYKTGSIPSLSDVSIGKAAQMPLEALIFFKKGFPRTPILPLKELQYWGLLSEEVISIKEDFPVLVDRTLKNLQQLMVSFYNPSTPYLSYPRGFTKKGVYDHLSRIQEWYVVR